MDNITSQEYIKESEVGDYISGRFFRCVGAFLSWLKKGETYWFEYHGDGEYEVRSDNNLGKRFKMTDYQLMSRFVPVQCETDQYFAMKYWFHLGELSLPSQTVDEIIEMYKKLGIFDKKEENG